jgi:hypothetical protein
MIDVVMLRSITVLATVVHEPLRKAGMDYFSEVVVSLSADRGPHFFSLHDV